MDREALALSADDNVMVITSAGCNVLDYALVGPKNVHAVDANPRQTALLELKLAGIRNLCYADFFQIFGQGQHPKFVELYQDVLRPELSPFGQNFWDKRVSWFSGQHGGFYFFGLSGMVARAFRTYLRLRPALAKHLTTLFGAPTMAIQREIYCMEIAPRMWGSTMNWALSRQITLSMLGVPHPQRREVVAQHPGGVAGFVRASLEYLAYHLPFSENYFYSVYVHGSYTQTCCPEYLKKDQFTRLKTGLVDRISAHTCTVTEFLERSRWQISHFVLLDHMDWMSSYYPDALDAEWTAILARAAPRARIIFRSAHAHPKYLERVRLPHAGSLRDLLRFDVETAQRLTLRDRVHTYAGFHIANVVE